MLANTEREITRPAPLSSTKRFKVNPELHDQTEILKKEPSKNRVMVSVGAQRRRNFHSNERASAHLKKFQDIVLSKNVLTSHLFSTGLAILFIIIQNFIDDSCFYPKKCLCAFFPTRIMSALRECIGLSINFLTMGYYCIFMLKESFPMQKEKKIVLSSLISCNFIIRISAPSQLGAFVIDVASGLIWAIGLTSLYLIFMKKLKWNFKQLAQRTRIPMTVTFLLYLHSKSSIALRAIQYSLKKLPHGELVYLLVISAFNTGMISLFFLGNKAYSDFIKKESRSLSPQIYYSKYVLCIITGHQIGIFLILEFNSLNFWIGLFAYLGLVVRLHTSYSFFGDTLIYIYNKALKKPFVLDSKLDSEFYRILRFQHIEITLIFIARLICINISKRWTYFVYENDYHIKNCSLQISDTFLAKMYNLTLLAISDFILTICLILYESKKGKLGRLVAVEEDLSFFARVLVNLSFHSTMEYYMVFFYDMRT